MSIICLDIYYNKFLFCKIDSVDFAVTKTNGKTYVKR